MRRIVLASQKGGTSKTTTAVNLAVGLARLGRRVLVIDCDAQGNAGWSLTRGQGGKSPTLADVLLRRAAAEEAIRPSAIDGVDLLPSDSSLNAANVALIGELGRDTRLRSAMAPLDGQWDAVILDTAPSFTTTLANALVYGEEVITPADGGVYSLLGLVELQQTIAEVRDAYGNAGLRLAGVLLTKTTRTAVCRDVEAELRSRFGELIYRTTIPASAKVEEAATRGLSVLEHAPHSPAGRAYQELVEEVWGDGRDATERSRGASVRGARKVDAA
jgi:chromosome partitioning protein